MIVYFVMYLMLFIFHRTNRNINVEINKKNNIDVIVLITILIGVISLRHPIMGWDLQYGRSGGYIASFQRISYYPWSSILNPSFSWLNYEKGFIILNKAISMISNQIQWYLFVCAFLSLIPIGVIIRKYSKDYFFSIIVYLGLPSFLMLFSGMRQNIGIALCFLSTIFIVNKKPLFFIALVIIASFFHQSAIVYLIAYPVYHMKINKNQRIYLLFGIPIVYIFRVQLFKILSKILRDNATLDYNGAFTLLLVLLLIYCFCIVFIDQNDKELNGFLNCFYISILCMCFGNIYQLAVRIGYYFMISLIIVLPNIVYGIQERKTQFLVKIGIEIVFILYALYSIWSSGTSWALAYPYHFFWETL